MTKEDYGKIGELPKGKLTLAEAIDIKAMLWEGEKQRDIAARFGVSQTTVSSICRGYQWPEAVWPDNTKGRMSDERWKQLKPMARVAYRVARDPVNETLSEKVAARYKQLVESGKEVNWPDEGDTDEDIKAHEETLAKIQAVGKTKRIKG